MILTSIMMRFLVGIASCSSEHGCHCRCCCPLPTPCASSGEQQPSSSHHGALLLVSTFEFLDNIEEFCVGHLAPIVLKSLDVILKMFREKITKLLLVNSLHWDFLGTFKCIPIFSTHGSRISIAEGGGKCSKNLQSKSNRRKALLSTGERPKGLQISLLR